MGINSQEKKTLKGVYQIYKERSRAVCAHAAGHTDGRKVLAPPPVVSEGPNFVAAIVLAVFP